MLERPKLFEEDSCLNENLLKMTTRFPVAIATGFADSAEPGARLRVISQHSSAWLMRFPVNQNAMWEDAQNIEFPKLGEVREKENNFFQDSICVCKLDSLTWNTVFWAFYEHWTGPESWPILAVAISEAAIWISKPLTYDRLAMLLIHSSSKGPGQDAGHWRS